MKISKMFLFILIALLFFSSVSIHALEYPEKAIQFIVPWSPGGGSDTLMRIVAKHLEKYLEVPIAVINQPGVSGTLGLKEFLSKPSNGYYIAQIHDGLLAAYHTGITDVNYDSFIPVASMTGSPQYLAAHKDTPYNTFEEFVSYAQENPDKITCGMTMKGIAHFWMAILADLADTSFKYVSYEGTGDRVQATVSGFVDIIPVDYPSGYQYVKSGHMKFLASATNERLEMTPEIPTMKEFGYDIIWNVSRGIVVPKGTPEEIVNILNEALRKVANDEDFISEIERTGGKVEFVGYKDYKPYLDKLNDQIINVADKIEG